MTTSRTTAQQAVLQHYMNEYLKDCEHWMQYLNGSRTAETDSRYIPMIEAALEAMIVGNAQVNAMIEEHKRAEKDQHASSLKSFFKCKVTSISKPLATLDLNRALVDRALIELSARVTLVKVEAKERHESIQKSAAAAQERSRARRQRDADAARTEAKAVINSTALIVKKAAEDTKLLRLAVARDAAAAAQATVARTSPLDDAANAVGIQAGQRADSADVSTVSFMTRQVVGYVLGFWGSKS